MKRLKSIENHRNNVNKSVFKKLGCLNKLSLKPKEILDEIKELDKEIDYTKLICIHTNGKIFDFNIFRRLRDFIRSIYYADILIKQAINKENEI